MGKESIIGLAVITVLLGIFGFVLYKRVSNEMAQKAVAEAAKQSEESDPADTANGKLSSGPLKQGPTMLAGQKASSEPAPGDISATTRSAASTGSRYESSGRSTESTVASSAGLNQFNTAGDAGARGSRYSNSRYGDTPPTDAASAAYPTRSAARSSNDPFMGHSASSAALTSNNASAALVEGIDTQPGAVDQAGVTAEVSGTAANPLRGGTSDIETVGATDVPARPSSRYSSGPRNYDVYPETPNGSSSAIAGAATAVDPQGARQDSLGGSGFRPAGSSRYSSMPNNSTPNNSAAGSMANNTSAAGGFRAVSRESRPAGAASYSSPAPETYTVEPNDNYWTVSEKVYGTGSYFQALQEHNRGDQGRDDLLRTGDVLSVPSVETLAQKYPALCPKPSRTTAARASATVSSPRRGGRTYVVEQGDTLFDIARFELGRAARWAEIYELNRDVIGDDFDHLDPGTELTLPGEPGEAASESFTRRPNSALQR